MKRELPHIEAVMMGKIVNVFPGLDDSIQPVQDDEGERFLLYPNGQKVAETILVDYSSLQTPAAKGPMSFSKALSQGTIINRKTKPRTIEAQRRRRKQRFNAKFSNKYLKDARTYEKKRPAFKSVQEQKVAIIYEEPDVTFADIAPFVDSYTDALLDSYKRVSENEGKLHTEKLNEIVKQAEDDLVSVIKKQQVYLAAVRKKVDKMLDRHAGKRQLVYDLREAKRQHGNMKAKNSMLGQKLVEAQEKMLQTSTVGAAGRKLRLTSQKNKVGANIARLKTEHKTLERLLPELQNELQMLELEQERIKHDNESKRRDIEDMEMEIEVEQKMAKLKVAMPDDVRKEMQERTLTLNSYSMYFKELATGLGFSLQCKVCEQRLIEPRQIWTCGHVFCKECVHIAASSNGRLKSFEGLMKMTERYQSKLHGILNDYNANGKISRIDFEIALRRVNILLNEDQKNILWNLIDPLHIDSASIGTVKAVLSGKFEKVAGLKAIVSPNRVSSRSPSFGARHRISIMAAKSKFATASKIEMRDTGVSLCPFCKLEKGKRQFVKDDPLTDKILHRLGFFESGNMKGGDILTLCDSYKSSLDNIEMLLR